MKISVLTPSIRPAGLEILQKSLKNQSFKDFEWIQDIGLGDKHDLNQAWNRMLKRAKGELIVFYQDYIKIEPDGLQKFWDAYQANPKTMFTAPVGKSQNLNFTSSPFLKIAVHLAFLLQSASSLCNKPSTPSIVINAPKSVTVATFPFYIANFVSFAKFIKRFFHKIFKRNS